MGNKKKMEEPNFVSEKMIEQIELFDELDTFKKIASQARMDEERELLKEDLYKESHAKAWLGRLATVAAQHAK